MRFFVVSSLVSLFLIAIRHGLGFETMVFTSMSMIITHEILKDCE